MPYHVSKTRFAQLVDLALQDVPEQFVQLLEEVPVEIKAHPSEEQLRSVRITSGNLLLGLYVGRPRTQRSVWDSATLPDAIFVFQESIEQVCRSEEELISQVRKTVLHEIGHHFGMTEDDLTRLGYG